MSEFIPVLNDFLLVVGGFGEKIGLAPNSFHHFNCERSELS